MSVLNRKVLRDLMRMWPQVLAISLVMACGVATIIIAMGSYRSLDETRSIFYDRYRFGSVFASASRAPTDLKGQISAIDGIGGLELRIVQPVLLDMDGMVEPATGVAVSIPDFGEPSVNRLYIRSGRLPEAGREGEVAVLESFAIAHRMAPGSTFRAIMNGKKRTLTATAIVLSPEYIYAIGPGDIVPDQRRFGVFFMPRSSLAGIFDMQGAFNDLSARTLRGARIAEIKDRIDTILKPFGGTGSYDRSEQVSHSFLDNELVQLKAMATVIPPIFLLVSAFLVNMILSRLIALEREQIGLLKAVGYGDLAIGWHYAKMTIVIAVIGSAIGAGAGIWLGRGMTRLYAEFFYFPFLVFRQSIDLYVLSILVSVASALAGALRAMFSVARLAPAVAMQPPTPMRFRSLLGGSHWMSGVFSQLTIMVIRNLIRKPLRSFMTILGTSLSISLLIAALFSYDAIESMIETVFFRAERQDATITFDMPRAAASLDAIRRLPGVMRAEPFRNVPVILTKGQRSKRLVISSINEDSDLSQLLDVNLVNISAPYSGLLVSERVAKVLHLQIGDSVETELIEQGHRLVRVPVTSIVQNYVGLAVYMRSDALARLTGQGERLSGARVAIDRLQLDDLYRRVKNTPAIASIGLQQVARDRMRSTIGENIGIVTVLYTSLALIVTFGVVYNSARIRLSEQGRELASLRVLGFTRAEVSLVLLVELAIVVVLAQPLGWLLGAALAWVVANGLESDLFRIPFVIQTSTYAYASLFVMLAAAVSALVVRRRIDRLDLVSVLKTRE